MGVIDLEKIVFSDVVKSDWRDAGLWENIKRGEGFVNPKTV